MDATSISAETGGDPSSVDDELPAEHDAHPNVVPVISTKIETEVALEHSNEYQVKSALDPSTIYAEFPATKNSVVLPHDPDHPSEAEPDEVDEDEDEDGDSEGWETESLVEELFLGFDADSENHADGSVCTPEESKAYRARLHEIGAEEFIRETISAGTVSAKKLCTAFGLSLGMLKFLEDAPDTAYYRLLGLAITRELNKRQKLPQYNTIDDAVELLKKSQNIIVITGAGISTNLGIPDFRSKHTGFYSKLREAGIEEPEEVFDIHRFDEDPSLFYSLAGDIVPEIGRTTPTHAFIRMLQDKGKLLTNYTQNIDNVEQHAGIDSQKLIQCHGSWATATCRKCGYKVPGAEIYPQVRSQKVASCKVCEGKIAQSVQLDSLKRKRMSNSAPGAKKPRFSSDSDSDDDGRYDIQVPGVMKPDITFFGEQLPDNFFARFNERDRNAADMVIVIGTSMQVAPVSEIPLAMPANIPQIYISRDPVRHIDFDIDLLGDCDLVCAELCRRAGWNLQHTMLPAASSVEIKALNEEKSKWTLKPLDIAVADPAPA